MFKFKLEQCWKLFNLNSHLIKEKNRLMCNEIKKMLIDHGLYSIPKLYFARGLVEIDRKRESWDNLGVLHSLEDKELNKFRGKKIVRKKQYRVVVKWLSDSENHKELMSEED
ncbi:hypothetical protein TCAL_14835 [Tigriopus californicus]|uniref:Chromo domain-containing protein n=1 Tax=Tigriopus californicus TaxID=6832 RepID=A0A553PPC7_TIGCA|nr:hypothetical protein TCAL_14835 [Tigriopus californicus]